MGAKQQRLAAFMLSPGVLNDPWRGPRPWPALSSLFTTAGWRALGKKMARPLNDLYTLARLQSVPNFSRKQFTEDAREMYREINRLIAGNHHTALRHVTSEKALTDIKREVKLRKAGGWARVDWKFLGFEEGSPRTLQGRYVQMDAKRSDVGFAQMTLEFRSKQTFAVYDEKGRLVAGDPDEVLTVEDVWVFEHGLNVPNPRWRLAARLSMPGNGNGGFEDSLSDEYAGQVMPKKMKT